jgi:ElaB/YqjD/DUF883 family membrane-anchored ribosome-binding protein
MIEVKKETAMTEPELQKQIDDLKADLKAIRTDLGGLARILKDLGVGKVDEARSSVEEGVEAGREELRRRWEEARGRGRKTMDDFEQGIGQHPLSSVLAAFGVGFLIAKLMDLGGRR